MPRTTKYWVEVTPTPEWYVLKTKGDESDICVANGSILALNKLCFHLERGDLLLNIAPMEMGVRQHYLVGGKAGDARREEL